VPWKWPGGEVSLEWSPSYGSSEWVDPWSSSFSASPPAECPTELVTPAIRCPSADFIFPVKSGYIGWLYKEPTNGIDPSGLHSGLDFWVDIGTPVMAVATGYVSRGPGFSDIENSYNLGIYYPSLGVETYTNNLLNLQVNKGSTVKAGTVIGYAGSYGAHFHWSVGIKEYNDQDSNWTTTTPHLDPTQYLTPDGNLNWDTGARENRSAPLYSWCNIAR
jgi:murein DD-endopeptidase MepM/ murein hydrolase activator NlpD